MCTNREYMRTYKEYTLWLKNPDPCYIKPIADKSNLITICLAQNIVIHLQINGQNNTLVRGQHMEPAEVVTIPAINMQCKKLNVQTFTVLCLNE